MRTLRKLNILGAIAALLSTTLLLGSCVSDDDNNPVNPTAPTALVTFIGNRTSGTAENSVTRSYFELLTTENHAFTLYSTAETALQGEKYKDGQRMVLTYQPTQGQGVLADGEVQIMRAPVLVWTSEVETATTEEAQAANAPMHVMAINRTGNYINLEARLPYYTEREYSILLDESTAGSDMPELYVTTTAKGYPQGTTTSDIASFDITTVWRNPAISGIKIHINNTGSTQQVYNFLK
jgi:hypothetical protein